MENRTNSRRDRALSRFRGTWEKSGRTASLKTPTVVEAGTQTKGTGAVRPEAFRARITHRDRMSASTQDADISRIMVDVEVASPASSTDRKPVFRLLCGSI